jgi:hypothetical protein
MKPLIWIAGTIFICQAAWGDTISVTPTADTTISDGSIQNADGFASTYITGRTASGARARALLRFNFADIPTGSVVNSVSLTVNVERNHSGSAPQHELHRLLADWTEIGATWNNSGLAPWTGGGNAAAVSDANAILGSPGPYTFSSTPALVATVQQWLTNSGTNFGWVLRYANEPTSGDALRITAGPSLVIEFTPPPPPLPTITISAPRVAEGKFQFDFIAEGGFVYVAQYKEALEPGNWTDFAWIPDPGASTLITVEDPLTTTSRFYRVIVP